MRRNLDRTFAALLLAAALALPAAAAHPRWDASSLYRGTWSAGEMLGAEARGAQGEAIGAVSDIVVGPEGGIRRIVVGVSGFAGIGERHIGVPWSEVRIGPDMAYVQVPVREENLPRFSLFTGVEDDVEVARRAWRVNELIGDSASLEDAPRYGIVTDVIFDGKGKAQGVVVDRAGGPWGGPGGYGYPYAGRPATGAYRIPYGIAQAGAIPRFDYLRLGRESPYASEAGPRAEQQRRAQARMGHPRAGAGATAGSAADPGLYRNTWSAQQMLGTPARGAGGEAIGRVSDVVVGAEGVIRRIAIGVSGLIGIGERHIGVPWSEVRLGPGMSYVQVPVRQDNLPRFSLFKDVEDDVQVARSAWRAKELIGDYARLEDLPRYGLLTDVIFDAQGEVKALIVDRGAGWWGPAGWYAFPYAGYDPDAGAYRLPYRSAEIDAIPRFDYVELDRLSRYAGASADPPTN